MSGENENKSIASFWDAILKSEFEKETDRGAVILAASLFDIQLESLIKSFLVADQATNDELFDGASAPLTNFSSKILMAFRLGLITKTFARDLNLIRKVRNEFAHNIHGCTFNHSSVKSRVHELSKSSNICEKSPLVRKSFPDGSRGDFLINASWMLWALTSKTEKIKALSECKLEFGYLDLNEKEAIKTLTEKRKTSKPELPENP